MYLESGEGRWKCHSIRMSCDECKAEYKGRICTSIKQMEQGEKHLCRICVSRKAGKKTGAKMAAIYSQLYSGDGNPAKKPGVGEKISATKKGVAFSEAHKQALRKPKSKTDKIKEAANRPEEIIRRRNLMIDLLKSGKFQSSLAASWQQNSKTPKPIFCRSGLERRFLERCQDDPGITIVESAEYLEIPYTLNGKEHVYLPDFKLTLSMGSTMIVETKSSFLQLFPKAKIKEIVLKEYCSQNGFGCIVINEKEIEQWFAP